MKNKLNVPNSSLLMNHIYLRTKLQHDFFYGMRRVYLIRSILLTLMGSFLIPSFGFNRKKYLIGTHRLLCLISKQELQDAVLVGGVREFIMALKFGTGYINTSWFYIVSFLYSFISGNSRYLYASSFSRFVQAIATMARPALVFIDSDGLPYQRSICLAAQQANAKVVCIQHGIFHSPYKGIDGSLSDLNLVLDDKQLNLFIESGIESTRLALLDTVMVSSKHFLRGRQEKRVVLVGEGMYSHDRAVYHLYTQTLIKLKQELNKLGIRTYFRPHPSERHAVWRQLKLFPLMRAKRGMDLTSKDIYIGASSSLLVDAAKIGAHSIQISDMVKTGGGFGANFEDYGVCRCCVEELPNKVVELLNSPTPNEAGDIFNRIQEISIDKLFSLIL